MCISQLRSLGPQDVELGWPPRKSRAELPPGRPLGTPLPEAPEAWKEGLRPLPGTKPGPTPPRHPGSGGSSRRPGLLRRLAQVSGPLPWRPPAGAAPQLIPPPLPPGLGPARPSSHTTPSSSWPSLSFSLFLSPSLSNFTFQINKQIFENKKYLLQKNSEIPELIFRVGISITL